MSHASNAALDGAIAAATIKRASERTGSIFDDANPHSGIFGRSAVECGRTRTVVAGKVSTSERNNVTPAADYRTRSAAECPIARNEGVRYA